MDKKIFLVTFKPYARGYENEETPRTQVAIFLATDRDDAYEQASAALGSSRERDRGSLSIIPVGEFEEI